jgi:GntR family transcriptional regulator, transcriptional repressor for pyruvate dehydrogenase complex
LHVNRLSVYRVTMAGTAIDATTAFSPVRATRTFETAITSILEGVERSRLRAGDRLPNAHELAAQLEISVPTLRQALVVLSRAGVVEVRPGKNGGIFLVTDLIPTEAISSAVAYEEEAAIEALRARRVLEPAVVLHATAVADELDYVELERTINLLRDHLGDRSFVMRADAMFHRALVRACHNRTLQEAMQALARGLAPVRDAYGSGLRNDRQTLEVHTAQLEAMRARDEAALREILDRHFRLLEVPFAKAIRRPWSELFGTDRD